MTEGARCAECSVELNAPPEGGGRPVCYACEQEGASPIPIRPPPVMRQDFMLSPGGEITQGRRVNRSEKRSGRHLDCMDCGRLVSVSDEFLAIAQVRCEECAFAELAAAPSASALYDSPPMGSCTRCGGGLLDIPERYEIMCLHCVSHQDGYRSYLDDPAAAPRRRNPAREFQMERGRASVRPLLI